MTVLLSRWRALLARRVRDACSSKPAALAPGGEADGDPDPSAPHEALNPAAGVESAM